MLELYTTRPYHQHVYYMQKRCENIKKLTETLPSWEENVFTVLCNSCTMKVFTYIDLKFIRPSGS
jgi:hypothetical protein